MKPRANLPGILPLSARITGVCSVQASEWRPRQRNPVNRSVDGRVEKFSCEAVGMTRNRVFLQPRYVKIFIST